MTAWIQHVKQYAAQHGCSYKEALSKARPSYHSQSGKGFMKNAHTFVKNHRVVSRLGHFAATHLGGKHAATIHQLSDVAGELGYGLHRKRR